MMAMATLFVTINICQMLLSLEPKKLTYFFFWYSFEHFLVLKITVSREIMQKSEKWPLKRWLWLWPPKCLPSIFVFLGLNEHINTKNYYPARCCNRTSHHYQTIYKQFVELIYCCIISVWQLSFKPKPGGLSNWYE